MRLTLYSDLSLRLLMYLAVKEKTTASVREVSEAYRISRGHLIKIVQELTGSGFVETVRGRTGGVRLRRPADEIVVGDVLRATERDFRLAECFSSRTSKCVIAPVCRLRVVLHSAMLAFLDVVDEVTVADLVARPSRLGVIFGIEPEPLEPAEPAVFEPVKVMVAGRR